MNLKYISLLQRLLYTVWGKVSALSCIINPDVSAVCWMSLAEAIRLISEDCLSSIDILKDQEAGCAGGKANDAAETWTHFGVSIAVLAVFIYWELR